MSASGVPRPGRPRPSTTTVRTVCPRNCYCTCGMLVTLAEGRIVRIEGDPENPATGGHVCLKGISYARRVTTGQRLLHPLRRTTSGAFEQVTWDAALSDIAERLDRVRSERAPESALYYEASGSHGGLGRLAMAFWHQFGGCTLTYGDLCWPAGLEATRLTYGDNRHNHPRHTTASRFILLWGHNPAETNVHQMRLILEAQDRGAVVALVDPRGTDTADSADVHLRPRPGTDAALALGLARVIVDAGLHDREFLDRHAFGVERYLDRLHDYPLGRVAEITGVRAADIEQLALDYARTRPALLVAGFGLQRHHRAGQTMRAVSLLPALTGNIGVAGGGWQYANLNSHRLSDPPLPPEPAGVRRAIPVSRLGPALGELAAPPVTAAWIEKGNPASQNPRSGTVRGALARLDLLVVVDQFMTDTARLAHYVLPAKTMFEEEDLVTAYWHPYLQLRAKVWDPPGEVKTETEIWRLLGERFGFDTRYFPKDEAETRALLVRMLPPAAPEFTVEGRSAAGTSEAGESAGGESAAGESGAAESGAGKSGAGESGAGESGAGESGAGESGAGESGAGESGVAQDFSPVLESLRHRPLDPTGEGDLAFADLRFPTPSGKIEFASEEAVRLWQVDAVPDYVPLREGHASPLASRFPLQLLSCKTRDRIHSQFGNLDWVRDVERPHRLDIHPSDAQPRGLADGDRAVAWNDRGRVELVVRLDEGLRPGVVHALEGRCHAGDPDINVLTDAGVTDMNHGATFYECLVEVASMDGRPVGEARQSERLISRNRRSVDARPSVDRSGPSVDGHSSVTPPPRDGDEPAAHEAAQPPAVLGRGFVLDLHRCVGCAACVLACRLENGWSSANPWRRVLPLNLRRRPGGPTYFLSVACHHCSRPACLDACPSRAYEKRPDGLVIHHESRCIGCRYCEMACPFGAPRYDAARGVMTKCHLCHERLDSGGQPACTAACPTGALSLADPSRPTLAGAPPSAAQSPGLEPRALVPGFADPAGCRPNIRFAAPRGRRRAALTAALAGLRAQGSGLKGSHA
jgi:anaerobic selenocysteine-containing dehydrogenase/Fe-S-cluster-containing dehydrogenase component